MGLWVKEIMSFVKNKLQRKGYWGQTEGDLVDSVTEGIFKILNVLVDRHKERVLLKLRHRNILRKLNLLRF